MRRLLMFCKLGLHEWDTRWLPPLTLKHDGPERFCRRCGFSKDRGPCA